MVMKIILLIIFIAFIIFGVSGITWAYCSEKKNYNKGICPKCGKPLKCIDVDSHGGRWYVCTDRYDKEKPCHYDCWVSYDVDSKN